MFADMNNFVFNNLIFNGEVILIDSDEFYIKKTKNGFSLSISGYSSDNIVIKRLRMDKEDYINLALKNNGINKATFEYPSIFFKDRNDVVRLFKDLDPFLIARKFL